MDTEKLFLGKYRILRVLGQGGMSKVYLAENVNLETKWAIKEIKKNKNQHVDLLAEPKALKNLRHSSLPRIFDINENEEYLYIIQDYIEGEDLSELIKRSGSIEENRVLKWAKQIVDVYIYLHNLKPNPLIYRDMKPGNLIIDKEDNVKIIDFGIAREFKTGLTEDTTMLGTRGYASPEQYGTAQTDIRSDIYSLGITLYHLLTSISPNEPSFDTKTLSKESSISNGMINVLEKCIENNPEKRFQTAEELMHALENIHQWNAEYKKIKKQKLSLKITSILTSIVSITSILVYVTKLKTAILLQQSIVNNLLALLFGVVMGVVSWQTYHKQRDLLMGQEIVNQNDLEEGEALKSFGKLKVNTKPAMAFFSPRSSGKTEIACNTALALSKMGKKVTLLDLDHESYGTVYNFMVAPGEEFENYYKLKVLIKRINNYLKNQKEEMSDKEIQELAIHRQKNLSIYSGNQEIDLIERKPELERHYYESIEPELLKSDLPKEWLNIIKEHHLNKKTSVSKDTIEYLIRKLIKQADVVVIDVGQNTSDSIKNLLIRSEHIEKYLVTTENLEDLNSIAHKMSLSQDIDYIGWNLIVNKVFKKQMFKERELKQYFSEKNVEFLRFQIKSIIRIPYVSDLLLFKKKRKCVLGYNKGFDESIVKVIKSSAT